MLLGGVREIIFQSKKFENSSVAVQLEAICQFSSINVFLLYAVCNVLFNNSNTPFDHRFFKSTHSDLRAVQL